MSHLKTRPARRAPPQIGRYTGSVFMTLAKKTKFVDPALAAHWPTIVGPEIAILCRPGRLTGGRGGRTLEIVAPNGAAAAQAQFQAGEIVERANRFLGPGTVARIAVRQRAGAASGANSRTEKAGGKPFSSLEDVLNRMRQSVNRRTEDN